MQLRDNWNGPIVKTWESRGWRSGQELEAHMPLVSMKANFTCLDHLDLLVSALNKLSRGLRRVLAAPHSCVSLAEKIVNRCLHVYLGFHATNLVKRFVSRNSVNSLSANSNSRT